MAWIAHGDGDLTASKWEMGDLTLLIVTLLIDLAELYGVEIQRFNEAVKRNTEKFPADLMFELTAEEFANLRPQFATSSLIANKHGGRRYALRVFTEHGALMAAMVLNSPRAVQVSLYVVRTFVRMHEAALQHRDLAQQLAELQDKTQSLAIQHETFSRHARHQLKQVFDTLRELVTPPQPHKRPIGFVHPQDKSNLHQLHAAPTMAFTSALRCKGMP